MVVKWGDTGLYMGQKILENLKCQKLQVKIVPGAGLTVNWVGLQWFW